MIGTWGASAPPEVFPADYGATTGGEYGRLMIADAPDYLTNKPPFRATDNMGPMNRGGPNLPAGSAPIPAESGGVVPFSTLGPDVAFIPPGVSPTDAAATVYAPHYNFAGPGYNGAGQYGLHEGYGHVRANYGAASANYGAPANPTVRTPTDAAKYAIVALSQAIQENPVARPRFDKLIQKWRKGPHGNSVTTILYSVIRATSHRLTGAPKVNARVQAVFNEYAAYERSRRAAAPAIAAASVANAPTPDSAVNEAVAAANAAANDPSLTPSQRRKAARAARRAARQARRASVDPAARQAAIATALQAVAMTSGAVRDVVAPRAAARSAADDGYLPPMPAPAAPAAAAGFPAIPTWGYVAGGAGLLLLIVLAGRK